MGGGYIYRKGKGGGGGGRRGKGDMRTNQQFQEWSWICLMNASKYTKIYTCDEFLDMSCVK